MQLYIEIPKFHCKVYSSVNKKKKYFSSSLYYFVPGLRCPILLFALLSYNVCFNCLHILVLLTFFPDYVKCISFGKRGVGEIAGGKEGERERSDIFSQKEMEKRKGKEEGEEEKNHFLAGIQSYTKEGEKDKNGKYARF